MLITITFLNVQSLEGLIRHDQFLSPKDPLGVGLRAGTWPEFKIFVFLKVTSTIRTITSQYVPSEAQIKNFFYFVENLCTVLKIFKFLYF